MPSLAASWHSHISLAHGTQSKRVSPTAPCYPRKAPRSINYRLGDGRWTASCRQEGCFDFKQNGYAAAILAVVFLNVVLGPMADRHSITRLVKNGFVTSVGEGSLSSQNCVVTNSF